MTVSAGVSADVPPLPARARDHRFHALQVRRIVAETADTVSLVLAVPDELRDTFSYRAGQFLTFRIRVGGEQHLRSYSMSSSPDVDDELTVTIKRVEGGVVSNWLNVSLCEGDPVDSTCPAGRFCLDTSTGDLIGFAGGSGITPVISLMKTALATTDRSVRLLYANRDRGSVIFDRELAALAERYPGRVDVAHRLDVEDGFVDDAAVEPFVDNDASYYICGPGPFMDLVERGLHKRGVTADRIHIERFTPAAAPEDIPPPFANTSTIQVTIELDGQTKTAEYRPGTTILQTARSMGLKPPYSCEAGDCATCMAKVIEGSVTMRVNNALLDDEVDDGYVLTCQSIPDTPTVHVVYED
jgi:3-ketosteroid 9alpha-monooxygenase subunit B